MRPVSQRWLDTVRGSHRAVFEVRACLPAQTGVDPTGTVIPIEGGDVQFDTESDILATVQITVADPTLYPVTGADLLAPFGNELFVRRGIDYGDGTIEWVSLGYYRITDVEQPDARGAGFRVMGSDRMCVVVADHMTPESFPIGQTHGAAVDYLINVPVIGAPTFTIEWDNTALRDTAFNRAFYYEDRYEGLAALMSGLGQIAYWDHRGYLVVRPRPAPTNPVWSVDSGQNGVLVSLGRALSDEGIYNAVIVTGGSPDPPADPAPPQWGYYDDDPASPTYYFSKFGRRTLFVTESAALTTAAVQALAEQLLRDALAQPRLLDLSAVPNAALEPFDPVRIRLGSGIDEVHLIRKLTIPLDAVTAMTAETMMLRHLGAINAF